MKHLKTALLTGLITCAATSAYAWDFQPSPSLPPISFHGFVSQGFLATTDYNYLGDTKDGSFQFSDVGLNFSVNPFPRTRVAAQAFLYDIGEIGDYRPVMDYALVEYTFNDYIGIRAGRIRRPQGIYNHVQDLDLARTSILLPQGLYDSRFRDFYVSLDGGSIFGTIPLGKAGSLSYEAYGGIIQISDDGGLAQQLRNSLPPNLTLDSIEPDPSAGVQLWWSTPVEGLRIGATSQYVDAGTNLDLQTPFGIIALPTSKLEIWVHQGSVEYQWKSWTLQAEYLSIRRYPEMGETRLQDSWYVGAAYRFNKWFEAGTYYTEAYNNVDDRDNSLQYQKDLALSLRFDVTESWIVKLEGHFINGTGLLNDRVSNPVQNDDSWGMVAFKTTYSF